jgi:hypothetical protein
MRKLIILMCTVALLTSMSAANAGRPTKLTLGPLQFDGQVVGSCGDFDILTDYSVHAILMFHYDAAGSEVRITRKLFIDNGNAIYYNSEEPSYWLPGDNGAREVDTLNLVNGSFTSTATTFKVTLPGHGVIFIDAGRVVYNDYTGEVLFLAGPLDYVNADFDALCAALRP